MQSPALASYTYVISVPTLLMLVNDTHNQPTHFWMIDKIARACNYQFSGILGKVSKIQCLINLNRNDPIKAITASLKYVINKNDTHVR